MKKATWEVKCVAMMCIAGMGATVNWAQGAGFHRVKAVFVSHDSSIHTSLSNRDVYVLQVTPRSGNAFNAVVVDNYPAYADALPFEGLPKDATLSIRLIRTPYCDRLSTSAAEDKMPCFAIDRNTWRASKGAMADVWWK